MSWKPWWKIYPERLKYELKALYRAGIEYVKDEEAFSKGVLCLHLLKQRCGALRVVFPDLYPYFRFELYADDLRLPHHQNPFGKNLCLIGRSTEFWHNKKDTLANFLTERLPQVLRTGASDDPKEVAMLEQHQAEPFSDYYSYHFGAAVIVDGGWAIDNHCQSGTLLIGVASPNTRLLQGAVLEVRGEGGNVLAESDSRLRQAFSKGQLSARWVRLSEAPKTNNIKDLFMHLRERDLYSHKIDSYPVNDGRLQVRAALFPEEINNWRRLDQGWIFVCRFEPQESWEKRGKKQKPRHRRKKRR